MALTLLNRIMQSSPIPIYVLQDGFLKLVNHKMVELTGYSAEELCRMSFADLIHPDDRSRIVGNVLSRIKGETVPDEYQFKAIDRNGKVYHVSGAYTIIDYYGRPAILGQIIDITQLKQIEVKLRESEQRYRAILDTIEDGYFEVDIEGKILFANDSACRIFGGTLKELKGKSYKELIAGENAKKVFKVFNSVYLTGIPTKIFDYDIITKDGVPKSIESSVALVRDPDGQPVGFCGIVRDITDRKKVEEALRKSEEKYRELYENAYDIIYIHDMQGNLISMNGAAVKTYGYSLQPGLNIDRIVAPEYMAIAERNIRLQLRDNIARANPYELLTFTKDGRPVWVEVSTRLIREGGRPVAVQGVARDITDRKRMKEALERSERLFRSLIENASDIVLLLDYTGNIRYASPSFKRIGGYNPEDVEGKSAFSFVHPNDVESLLELFAREIKHPGVTIQREFRYLHKDGSWRYVEVTGKNMVDDPVVEGVIINGRDITERKMMEEALCREKERLAVTLSSIGDAVIAVENDTRVVMINQVAENLTGWKQSEAIGRPLKDIFHIVNEYTREEVESPVYKVLLKGKVVGLANHTALIARDGTERSIADSAAPIRDASGKILGVILVFRDVTEERRREEALRESEKNLRRITDNMLDIISEVDENITFKYVSPSHLSIFGYDPDVMIGRNIFEYLHPDDLDKGRESFKKVMRDASPGRVELRYKHADGHYLWLDTVYNPLVDEFGRVYGAVLGSREVTDRKLAEEKIVFQASLLDQVRNAVIATDLDGKIVYWNRFAQSLYQWRSEEVVGKNFIEVIVPEFNRGKAREFNLSLLKTGYCECELAVVRKDGSIFPAHLVNSLLKDADGVRAGYVSVSTDISERKLVEEQLKYLSLHDPLTGLYNRAYFEEEMRRLKVGRQHPVSIIVTDVDGLKLVNDTMGHDAGDALLIATAGILKESLREGDVVSRIGGDEFAILLPNSDEATVQGVCERIRNSLSKYNTDNQSPPLSISIGCATGSDSSVSIDVLFKEADNNMYREKLHRSQSIRSSIVQTLMKALEERDFITEGHAERLQDLVVDLARKIGLPDRSLSDLRLLAQFHDIGKVGISDNILFKKGPLTPREITGMQRHCEIGHRIAQSAPDMVHIADWILKHHEWWNGRGYPLGLNGLDIPLECRILSIADAYDAMTSDRPYRRAMSHKEAVEELMRCAGTQFDPELVNVFLEVIEKRRKN
ncbi:MAG: sensor domain-containing diguanylate cyclase/phosphohydrolase [Bacillota bacterium]